MQPIEPNDLIVRPAHCDLVVDGKAQPAFYVTPIATRQDLPSMVVTKLGDWLVVYATKPDAATASMDGWPCRIDQPTPRYQQVIEAAVKHGLLK